MATPSSTRTTVLASDEPVKVIDFDAICLRIASPEDMLDWSYGEVLRPETINYRTLRPEREGLFDERIFGPTKDWECYCGKYKRVRYKGLTCDRCGVDITRAIVRRERMGHIALQSPVTHIWFLRGIPSKIGLLLSLSIQDLEKVVYFASFIVTNVDNTAKENLLQQIKDEFKGKTKQLEAEHKQKIENLNKKRVNDTKEIDKTAKNSLDKQYNEMIDAAQEELDEKLVKLKTAVDSAKKELNEICPLEIISESRYHELSLKYGHIFDVSIGAEAIHTLLSKINLKKLSEELEEELKTAIETKRKKIIRRISLVKNLIKNNARPEWMVITVLPVIPPELRPMVPLDGGRYATSDLNDLYRRVINRNNRLKKLRDLNAPEVIVRNEKRMLQESVDALIDNAARHGKTVTASTGQKRQLKSLADMLKGKQGRFRQNLLGKRVDYSGRSVIVVGPHLKLHQCGLPKRMALELFKPFVISLLIQREFVHNVRSANRFIESGRFEVWDILEEVTRDANVFLNRAPTLHRLGIQGFQPILIEGKAIQLHPLVCRAFNADFDGDQMAVHVPLTEEAKREVKDLMLSTKNLLLPSTGEPIIAPTQDMVWGTFYMTYIDKESEVKKFFATPEEAIHSYHLGNLKIQEKIKAEINGEVIETSVGRIMFNEVVPKELQFQNKLFKKGDITELVATILNTIGDEATIKFVDDLKFLAFENITLSGMSLSAADSFTVADKAHLVGDAENRVAEIRDQFDQGLLTEHERYIKTIEVWSEVKNKVAILGQKEMESNPSNPIYSMIVSGARGSIGQLTQVVGMKGLVQNAAGDIIELPIKGNFHEGVDVLEYFSSCHGTRRSLADTALRTANAGYLTRRLVDVAQDVIITEDDCGDTHGFLITKESCDAISTTLKKRIYGRRLLSDLKDIEGNIIVKKGTLISKTVSNTIPDNIQLQDVFIRSLLTCKTKRGVCRECYGLDLGRNTDVEPGTAVGIIAAQSIGEPGTQLTMRTFHTGGVAGVDITQGLPRVEELLEIRPPKHKAILSPFDGIVRIDNKIESLDIKKDRIVKIEHEGSKSFTVTIPLKSDVFVKNGDQVKRGTVLFKDSEGEEHTAVSTGIIKIIGKKLSVVTEGKVIDEITIPAGFALWVQEGTPITAGQPLSEGAWDLRELYEYRGEVETQKYIINEVQKVYVTQGLNLNDKHIEIIVRQLFSRMIVDDSGDTSLVPGDIITRSQYLEAIDEIKEGGKKPKVEHLLLGITKASLTTDSFLSAASFQETNRVLVDAAVTGKRDFLRGLKENVIIGRLVPAGTGFWKNREKLSNDEYIENEQ